MTHDAEAVPCVREEGRRSHRAHRRGFQFAVQCHACGWGTEFVKLRGVAEKLWNETKKPGKAD
jgi:hypothetical protein